MRWRWRLETRTPRQPSTPALPQILDFTRSVLGFSRGCQAKEVEERGGRGVGGREVMEEMARTTGIIKSSFEFAAKVFQFPCRLARAVNWTDKLHNAFALCGENRISMPRCKPSRHGFMRFPLMDDDDYHAPCFEWRKSLNRPQIAFGICRTINLSNLRVIMWGVVECQMNDSMISRHG
ncbi:hypothetical protein HZH66_009264 [Vespula vulgaris]|uniref:Uncharacterized protein n=2 Tax=Vespula TaxID=7451 RepID=A0A834NRH2_VESPE|nr:hypothetical protein HZH66_009264 [Vespula vulgaris]KAF7416585.1 hypothetical protein H0235_011116 [Vespula pensylvanica]